jgi:tetratricopeptide (TPR) repeat protein
LVVGLFVEAIADSSYPPHAVAALPEYCRDAQGFGARYGGSEETKKVWYQRLGPEMMHIHHYCRGLLLIQRARGSRSPARARLYESSIGEIDYMIGRVNQNYVLLPEMLTRKGEALLNSKQFPAAEQVLHKAIELKPDYWPAYKYLAEAFIARKNLDAARDVLKQGVSNAREPRALKRMLDDLDKPKN